MKHPFHYVLKVKLIRNLENHKIDFTEFEEGFYDENPLIARDKAFSLYQSYIDVFLEAKNINYETDRQARVALKPYIKPESDIYIGGQIVDFENSIEPGIGIFLVDDLYVPNESSGMAFKEIFIHGMGYIHFVANDPTFLIHHLVDEYEFYERNNIDTSSKEVNVVFCDRYEWEEGYRDDEPSNYTVLRTPFDWDGYDKPYWWGKTEEKDDTQNTAYTIEDYINQGEGHQIEFKPSLLYNFSSKKAGIGIKAIIAKAICAFLNSDGGLLFIGISDNGTIQGLDFDFQLACEKNPKDFFLLEFDQMISHFFSFSIRSRISSRFFDIEDKIIFMVAVMPSKNRPVFLNGKDGKEFYIRGEASSRQLTDIEQIVNYCIDKWQK